jgi:excinuclease ABC subunit A
VSWRCESIGDVPDMKVDEATTSFPACQRSRTAAAEGHGPRLLTMGQPLPTLSSGETQRMKLVTELAKVRNEIARRGQRRRTRCGCA